MKKLLLLTAVVLSISVSSTKGINLMRDGSKANVKVGSSTDNQLMLAYIDSFQIFTPKPVETKNDLLNSADSANSTVPDSTTEHYAKGQIDARKHHKRVIGNAALGFLLGPIGCLGAAIGNPKAPGCVIHQRRFVTKEQRLPCRI